MQLHISKIEKLIFLYETRLFKRSFTYSTYEFNMD